MSQGRTSKAVPHAVMASVGNQDAAEPADAHTIASVLQHEPPDTLGAHHPSAPQSAGDAAGRTACALAAGVQVVPHRAVADACVGARVQECPPRARQAVRGGTAGAAIVSAGHASVAAACCHSVAALWTRTYAVVLVQVVGAQHIIPAVGADEGKPSGACRAVVVGWPHARGTAGMADHTDGRPRVEIADVAGASGGSSECAMG